jgi:K+-transporting ATPase ATPase C chain
MGRRGANILIAARAYAIFTVLCGVLYTIAVTAIARVAFPRQSKGSCIVVNGKVVGSDCIGQAFISPGYFHSRPSAVSYNPLPSGASNLSVAGSALKDSITARADAFRTENGMDNPSAVPQDMLFASGSGLDPHISPDAAKMQVARIARVRGMNAAGKAALSVLVEHSIEKPQCGFLGAARINVLRLNCALDSMIMK